jgi:hypothetical protein
MKLNDKWGYGQLFGFSGLDGVCRFENDFIGTLTSKKIEIRFELYEWVKIHFPVKGRIKFNAITGDMIDASTKGGDFLIVFSDCDTLIGYSPVMPKIITQRKWKHVCSNDIDTYFITNKITTRKVYCVEQNEIYKSTNDAALKNNLSSGSIYNVCKRKSGCHTCGGFHWCFADEIDGFVLPKKKNILCVETGEIFDSCKIAGLSKNTNAAKIGAVCNGKRKSAGGFHWKYIE